MLPSSLPLSHSWDFMLPFPAPDEFGRFRVRFQLILSKRFHFLQNFTAFSFRFLRFLSNCMLTAQHKSENLCRVYTCRFDKQIPNGMLVKKYFLVDKLAQYFVCEVDRKLTSYCQQKF